MMQKVNYHYLNSIRRISEALGQPLDIEQMLTQTVALIFEIFDCDRAWILYPCDLNAQTYRIPYEHTRPEFPGAFDLNMEIPITDIAHLVFKKALAHKHPVTFMFDADDFVDYDEGAVAIKPLMIQSQMVTAVYPKIGKPWLLGLHQCSYQRSWTSDEKKLFNDISARIANALTEKLLYKQLQESEKRTASLLKLSKNLEQVHTFSEILQAAHQAIKANLEFHTVWIYLFADDLKTATLLNSQGPLATDIADRFPILHIEGDPLLEEIAKATHVTLVEDACKDPRTNKKLVAQLKNRTIVNVPIILSEKRLGALGMGSFDEEGIKVPEKAEVDFLVAIAGHVAVALDRVSLLEKLDQQAREQTRLALENAQLFETANQRALENARLFAAERAARDRMDRLQAATQVLSATLDLPRVFELILSELQRVIPYDSSSVQQLDGEYLEIIGGHGFPNLDDLLGITFNLNEEGNPNREVIHARKPIILDNAPNKYSGFHTEPHAQAGIRSWLGVPLIFGDNIIGMLALDKQEKGFYTEEHARIAQAFAAQAASAIVNAQLYDQLSDYAAQLEKRVEERTSELAKANEQLQELDRLKSKFVSDVSHELRTPVTNLNLYLDLLEQGKQDRWPQYFSVLRKQVGRLRQLIEDILDLSRLDLAANVKIEMESVDLNDVIKQVVEAHKIRAETANLKLEFIHDNQPAFILGERNQLFQVITNLVVNGINYTTQGHIRVRSYSDAAHNKICVEVSDTGMGIPPEDIQHIFDRFYRGQKTSQLTIPGNGLGLAIVKEVINQHHGTIEVQSEIDSGSTFRIIFPALMPDQ